LPELAALPEADVVPVPVLPVPAGPRDLLPVVDGREVPFAPEPGRAEVGRALDLPGALPPRAERPPELGFAGRRFTRTSSRTWRRSGGRTGA
jgi:hypothetical protein